MPNLQLAIDKKIRRGSAAAAIRRPAEAEAAPGDQHSIPSLFIIAGEALGALLVLVGGALMWRRHRRRVHRGRHATGSFPATDDSPMASGAARPATGSFPPVNDMRGARTVRNWSAVGHGMLNDTHGGGNQPSGMTAPISSVATMTTGRACPGCGSPHLPGDVFCSRCGTRMIGCRSRRSDRGCGRPRGRSGDEDRGSRARARARRDRLRRRLPH